VHIHGAVAEDLELWGHELLSSVDAAPDRSRVATETLSRPGSIIDSLLFPGCLVGVGNITILSF
jgi:hypothetical protein